MPKFLIFGVQEAFNMLLSRATRVTLARTFEGACAQCLEASCPCTIIHFVSNCLMGNIPSADIGTRVLALVACGLSCDLRAPALLPSAARAQTPSLSLLLCILVLLVCCKCGWVEFRRSPRRAVGTSVRALSFLCLHSRLRGVAPAIHNIGHSVSGGHPVIQKWARPRSRRLEIASAFVRPLPHVRRDALANYPLRACWCVIAACMAR